jgi:hypothetical protein
MAGMNATPVWPEFMTPDELRDLTGRRGLALQVRFLQAEGIPHKERGSRLLVSRVHVRDWLAGRPLPRASVGVNLAALEQMEAKRAEAKQLAAARKAAS